MKLPPFILHPDGDPQVMQNLLHAITNRDVTKAWEVTIKLYKEGKSDKQNRLQFMWHTEWAMHYGHNKMHAYRRYKYKYCLPIMLADPDEKFDHLRYIWGLVRDDPEGKAAVVRLIHTGDLDTAQMAMALTDYDRDTAANGLVFTDPADLKREAMGL